MLSLHMGCYDLMRLSIHQLTDCHSTGKSAHLLSPILMYSYDFVTSHVVAIELITLTLGCGGQSDLSLQKVAGNQVNWINTSQSSVAMIS